MPTVKTAVSIEESLFAQAEALAREMNTSRSRLFALALEEFVRSHRSRQIRERIDAAYAGAPDPAEQALQRRMRRQHKRIVEGEW